jgi:hypothetical protein
MRRDGELLVQLSRDTAEVATGDLVEKRGDRYEFTGRRSDVIVVGGAMETVAQLESYQIRRHYDGFLESGRVRGRVGRGK